MASGYRREMIRRGHLYDLGLRLEVGMTYVCSEKREKICLQMNSCKPLIYMWLIVAKAKGKLLTMY